MTNATTSARHGLGCVTIQGGEVSKYFVPLCLLAPIRRLALTNIVIDAYANVIEFGLHAQIILVT